MGRGVESRLITIEGIQFTVDLAQTDVSLNLVGAEEDLSVNGAIRYLQFGDNALLKGFSLTFPYQFGQGQIFDDSINLGLEWVDSAANSGAVTQVGDGGRLNISDPNYMYPMDVYVPMPTAATAKWGFRVSAITGDVSMINAPAVLDTLSLYCTFHLLIESTLPLIA